MSEVRVNNIVDYGGLGAPTFDNGAVISGVSSLGNQAKIGSNVTITSGGINVSGVTTAATLSGNLTGDVNSGFVTATSAVIGSGVTINAGGLNITGVVTATTFEGSGASMTGVAMSITPLSYNPDVNDSVVTATTGIGITFDHRILAGSGNVTLSVATNAGVAGTVVENFGVGSSVTIQGRKAIIDPTSDLTAGETYHISYPSGAFTNTAGDVSYVGTAYTFGAKPVFTEIWMWGANNNGQLGQNTKTANDNVGFSSPVQVPGNTWSTVSLAGNFTLATKADGTLWSWGYNSGGNLGQNNRTYYSSPVQIPGTTWVRGSGRGSTSSAIKTDGTLWTWGINQYGTLGQNEAHDTGNVSSPVQIPGTTWNNVQYGGFIVAAATKTDGTLWSWGYNEHGSLGLNQADNTMVSSPTQIPGTTWNKITAANKSYFVTKTDGTLWSWGYNQSGMLGQNEAFGPSKRGYSSPVQIPGTTWNEVWSMSGTVAATKTDGTLWAWGNNHFGPLGVNDRTNRSSPTQIPGTTWDKIVSSNNSWTATKTDGTLWSWGAGQAGQNAQNNETAYSSPVQIPGTDWSLDKVFNQNQSVAKASLKII